MDKFSNLPAVILAGGKSSRMGTDKALMPFDSSSSMAEFQYNKLSKIFNEVYISAKNNKFDFLDDNKLIKDNSDISSPMIALDSIFSTLKSKKIFIITVDTPLVTIETIQELIYKANKLDEDIVYAQDGCGNKHVLCSVFSRNIYQNVKKLLTKNIHKINYLVKNSTSKAILFTNNKEFSNINTKQEYLDLYQKNI